MRTRTNISMLLIVVGLFTTMSSCFKTEDPEFGLYTGEFYIIQQNRADGSKTFKPFAFFQLNEDAASTPIFASAENGFETLTLNKITNSIYVTAEYQYVSFNTLPMDNFVIKAQNLSNEAFTKEIPYSSVTIADTLGTMRITDAKYNGSSLSFKMNDVAKASSYAVICYSNKSKLRYRFPFTYEANKTVSLSQLVSNEVYELKIAAGNTKGVYLEYDLFPITAGTPYQDIID
ncbi:MAG: hypothetical protein ACRDDZ_11020 [Marinifilaceae bacterium]